MAPMVEDGWSVVKVECDNLAERSDRMAKRRSLWCELSEDLRTCKFCGETLWPKAFRGMRRLCRVGRTIVETTACSLPWPACVEVSRRGRGEKVT